MTKTEIIETYGDVLCGDQVRQILHISKRKCAWILQQGWIKCHDTGKKTRRYKIHIDDLFDFISDAEKHPEKYLTPPSEFSTKKNIKGNSLTFGIITSYEAPPHFRGWVENKWSKVKDTLTCSDVVKLTGYAKTTITNHISKGTLKSIRAQCGVVIPKKWLVDFMCTYGYAINKKSKKHRRLISNFQKESTTNCILP